MKTIQEVLQKYGETLVTFLSYSKYSFYFSGTANDGTIIGASIGGNADNIYRSSVNTDPITLNELNNKDEIIFLYGKDNTGNELFSLYEY